MDLFQGAVVRMKWGTSKNEDDMILVEKDNNK